jgi:hypothetical protein
MREPDRPTWPRVLLACGVLYSVGYAVANDVVAAALYQGYSRLSQAVSELSASGAPTKGFLAAMVPVFTGLMVAFGAGVVKAARGRRALRVTGGVLVAHGLSFSLWLLAPMSQRERIAAGGTPSDTLHIALTVVTIVLILAQLGSGAAALGRRFRVYSIVTAVAVVISGILTGVQSRPMLAGLPTPWLGLTERVGISLWLLWIAVLAAVLLRESAAREIPQGLPMGGGRPARAALQQG